MKKTNTIDVKDAWSRLEIMLSTMSDNDKEAASHELAHSLSYYQYQGGVR